MLDISGMLWVAVFARFGIKIRDICYIPLAFCKIITSSPFPVLRLFFTLSSSVPVLHASRTFPPELQYGNLLALGRVTSLRAASPSAPGS